MFDKSTERDDLIVKFSNLQIATSCYSTFILNFSSQDETLVRTLKNKEEKKNENINTINLLLFFKASEHAVLFKVMNVLFKTII